jgi:hypothetical protein
MKNKNTQIDLNEYVVFIPVENDDVLTALLETLGDRDSDDYDIIAGNDYVIVPHYRKEEILGLINEIESEDEDEE